MRRDRQGLPSRQHGYHHAGRDGPSDGPSDDRSAHRNAPFAGAARVEAKRDYRQLGSDSRNGGRPSAKQIQLNKRIIAARDAETILAIVSAEHGDFNDVNAATACSRLAKARRSCAQGPSQVDRGVQQLLSTVTRVAPSMKPQEIANMLWALATLGWQAADAAMRCALEGAAARAAPSMNAQNVANTVWALGRRSE